MPLNDHATFVTDFQTIFVVVFDFATVDQFIRDSFGLSPLSFATLFSVRRLKIDMAETSPKPTAAKGIRRSYSWSFAGPHPCDDGPGIGWERSHFLGVGSEASHALLKQTIPCPDS